MARVVDEERLVGKVREFAVLDDAAERAIRDYLKRQPKSPPLVSRKKAAEMLGIRTAHISRLIDSGEMPEPVPIEGGWACYRKSDIEDLRKRREQEKAEV